jgi:hypothetical protein
MKTPKAKLSRRNFLLAVGAGGAASAAAIVSKKNAADPAVADNGPPGKKGYQVTEHVRNYYRTAKI